MTGDDSKTIGEEYTKIDYLRKISGLVVIVVFSILSIYLGFSAARNGDIYGGLGIVGFGTFFSMLIGTFLITDRWELADGEFRKALTISIISIYFFSMAFANQIKADVLIDATKNVTVSSVVTTNIVGGVFDNLWAVVLVIIGFYFASRAIEKK